MRSMVSLIQGNGGVLKPFNLELPAFRRALRGFADDFTSDLSNAEKGCLVELISLI